LGGTNAHVILEEAPSVSDNHDIEKEEKVLTISAKTKSSLANYAEQLNAFLIEQDEVNLGNLCYTLSICRKHFDYRYSVPFHSKEDLINHLEGDNVKKKSIKSRENNLKVVFMFTGVGSQYPNMGKALYESNAIFKAELDKGIDMAQKITGINFLDVIFPSPADKKAISEINNIQPVIFIFEYALARLIMEYGLEATCMIGHSTGEYVAACLAGVFSYEDALQLVIKRGELGCKLPKGAMLGCSISEEMAREYVNDTISLAAVNGSHQTILSGDPDAIDSLMVTLRDKDISSIKLNSPVAGHSYMMDPFLDGFKEVFEGITLKSPAATLVSGVTGGFLSPEEFAKPEYWTSHVRQPVLFYNGIQAILTEYDNPVFVEIGAGNFLTNIVRKIEGDKEIRAVNLIRSPMERINDTEYWARKLGLLWQYGAKINWNKNSDSENHHKISLPTYAFEKHPYPCEVNPEINNYKNWSGAILHIEKLEDLISISQEHEEAKKGIWLILSSKEETALKVKNEITAAGYQAYTVNTDPGNMQKRIAEMTDGGVFPTDAIITSSNNSKQLLATGLSLADCPNLSLKRLYLLVEDGLDDKDENCSTANYTVEAAMSLIFSQAGVEMFLIDNKKADPEIIDERMTSFRERPDISMKYVPPETATEKRIKQIFETVLNMDDIGVVDNFFELGGDSLQGMMVLKRIEKEFDCELVIKDFFREPYIRAIATFIDSGTHEPLTAIEPNNEITI
jgi:acyl transferase domain-containing protein/acyl carrier protein